MWSLAAKNDAQRKQSWISNIFRCDHNNCVMSYFYSKRWVYFTLVAMAATPRQLLSWLTPVKVHSSVTLNICPRNIVVVVGCDKRTIKPYIPTIWTLTHRIFCVSCIQTLSWANVFRRPKWTFLFQVNFIYTAFVKIKIETQNLTPIQE